MEGILYKNTLLLIPDVCKETCKNPVPYVIRNFPIDDKFKEYGTVDINDIRFMLREAFNLPPLSFKLNISNSTYQNIYSGMFIHEDTKNLEEIIIGGYILTTYCGHGVEIAIFVPKNRKVSLDKYLVKE